MSEYFAPQRVQSERTCTQDPPLPLLVQSDGVKRVLLFIHGGLNTQLGALERVVDDRDRSEPTLYNRIAQAGYYPVFVNWPSSLTSTYIEGATSIRQGQKWPVLGGVTAPFAVSYDLLRSAARAPLVWTNQIVNDLATTPPFDEKIMTQDPQEVARQLVCDYAFYDADACKSHWPSKALIFKKPPFCIPIFPVKLRPKEEIEGHVPTDPRKKEDLNSATFPISVGEDQRTCFDMVPYFLSYVVTIPTRLLLGPLLDAFGTGAWDVMLRRTQMLFNREDEFQHRAEEINADFKAPGAANPETRALADIPARGGLSMFLKGLSGRIRRGGDWEITIVAHSMGTIVANQLLRHVMAQQYEIPIRDIVYMAAAASVQDVHASVLPYLRQSDQASFYNLMLHPVAEERERYGIAIDPTPRGSLLVMIDSFLAKPLTFSDRTAGRFENFMRSVHNVPTRLRPRVHIKSFGVGDAAEAASPVKHGEFTSRFKFWLPECWKPEPAMKTLAPRQCVYPPE